MKPTKSDSRMNVGANISPLALAVSPRKNGNSDFATNYFLEEFNQKNHPEMELLSLRSYPVKACVACGSCDKKGDLPCSLDAQGDNKYSEFNKQIPYLPDSVDNAPFLFDKLFNIPALLISSPIYFYHVPALFKNLIDRSQYWWMRKLQGHDRFNLLPAKRPAYLILIAARPQGLRLFEGALITLKYVLDIFNFELQNPLLLKGLDSKEALKNNPEALLQVKEYADFASQQLLSNKFNNV